MFAEVAEAAAIAVSQPGTPRIVTPVSHAPFSEAPGEGKGQEGEEEGQYKSWEELRARVSARKLATAWKRYAAKQCTTVSVFAYLRLMVGTLGTVLFTK